jgi:hypothetical protein
MKDVRGALTWVAVGALALVAVGAGLRLGRPARDPSLRTDDPAVGQARDAVRDLVVRDADGRRVPLAPTGRPHVLMVNSTSCGYCREALRDLARLQGDGGVPGLRVVTLEGEAAGRAMLDAAGVRGAFSAGPDGERDQVLLTFRIPGTPVLARTDAAGRVVETVPGYPGPTLFARWRDALGTD